MRRPARVAAFSALIVLAPALALAQGAAPQPPAPAAPSSSASSPVPGSSAGAVPSSPAGAPAPAGAPTASPAAPTTAPATAYGWTPTPAPKKHAHRRSAHLKPETPAAVMPGFETLADGSTRLFVQLTKPVPYDTKPGRASITYVLQGAHVDKRNNFNPLVTVHFNTPVTSARLAPHGKNLWFVVRLRADVHPTVTMEPTKEGGAMLRVEFPGGQYLPLPPMPAAAAPPPAPQAPPADTTPPVVSTPPAAR